MRYLIFIFLCGLFNVSVQAVTLFSVDDFNTERQDAILEVVGASEVLIDIEGAFHANSDEQLRIYYYKNGKTQGTAKSFSAGDKIAQKGLKIKDARQLKVSFVNNVGKKRPHPISIRVYQVPPFQRLQAILTPLNQKIDAILSHGANEVDQSIKHNEATFNNLATQKQKLDKSGKKNKQIRKEVAAALNRLSASYRDASDIRQKIKPKNNQALKAIVQYAKTTLKELDHVRKEVLKTEQEINYLTNNPITSGFDAENRQRLMVAAKQRIRGSLEVQEKGWAAFYKTQQQLYPLLEKHIRKVDLLLEVLATYADVYLQLSYAVELGQDINSALKILDDAAELEMVLKSLTNNFNAIKELRKELDEMKL